jgi:hypothetical protein
MLKGIKAEIGQIPRLGMTVHADNGTLFMELIEVQFIHITST